MSVEAAKKILDSLPIKPQHNQQQLIKLFPDFGPSRFLAHRLHVGGICLGIGFLSAGWSKMIQHNTTSEIEAGDQEYQVRSGLVRKIIAWQQRSAAFEERADFAQKVLDGESLPDTVLRVPITVSDMVANRNEDLVESAIKQYQAVVDGIPQDMVLKSTAVLRNSFKPLEQGPRTRLQGELESELKSIFNLALPEGQKLE